MVMKVRRRPVAAEVLVDQIRRDEDHRPRDDTDAQRERAQGKEFPAGKFAEDGVGHEEAGEGEIDDVSASLSFHERRSPDGVRVKKLLAWIIHT